MHILKELRRPLQLELSIKVEMPENPLMTSKELAYALRVNVSYVYRMRSAGFPMPAGKATLQEAREWLKKTNFSTYRLRQEREQA